MALDEAPTGALYGDRGQRMFVYGQRAVGCIEFLMVVGVIAALIDPSLLIPHIVPEAVASDMSTASRGAQLMETVANSFPGIVSKPSKHSVAQTVERLKDTLRSKEITLFALIDHSGEAEKVGMKMPPTKLLIFGSPKAGTPLMVAAPSIAIDLPLKVLVWEDSRGKVWLSYNSPDYLKERHGLPTDLLQNISVLDMLAAKAGE
jgi:uncharacterized protein (DUF302 family)